MSTKFSHSVIQCLTAIAQHHGLQVNPERLIEQYALTAEEPSSLLLQRIASDIGLKVKAGKTALSALKHGPTEAPAVARCSSWIRACKT